MPEIRLPGCAPTPLAHYLKALGILRLVAEQRDGQAMGHWEGECFVLTTALDEQAIQKFFLRDYRPTPIIAPWNGGSGFYPKDNATGITAIETGRTRRLAAYVKAIRFGRKLAIELQLMESPKGEEKARLLRRFRSGAAPAVLAWFDAAILLSGDEARYPPLLGTGGNDGRLDFTNNFMQRVTDVIDSESGEPSVRAPAWLRGSLFGEATPGLSSNAVGQFNPGGVGGPNASIGYEAGSLINSWDFVLMLEGALLFAAAASRRLESVDAGGLSYPFTVRNTGAGGGGAAMDDESNARAEIWMPLWERPAGLAELRILLAEGRARLRGHTARDGLDFARAVAALGVDRGIGAFQRYGFLMRSGKAYLAAPLGRVQVRRRPEADLIADLDRGRFLERLRRKLREESAPARFRALGHRLDGALMALAEHGGSARVQAVLVLLGALAPHLARLTERDKASLPPLPRLDAPWVIKADDGSVEFRLAAALASLYVPGVAGVDRKRDPALAAGLPMACHVAPLLPEHHAWRWASDSVLYVWGEGRLACNIVRATERRLLETRRAGLEEKPFDFRLGVHGQEIAAWLDGRVDEDRLGGLFAGLTLARMPDALPRLAQEGDTGLPAAYAVLKPFFTPDRLLRHLGFLPPEIRLPLTDDLIALLRAERVKHAVDHAWRRLRAAGVALPAFPVRSPLPLPHLSGERLLAALAVPMDVGPLASVLRELAPAHDSEPLTV
jgi:CRISPR-associated protein Csx17